MIDFQYFFQLWVMPLLCPKRGQSAIRFLIRKPQSRAQSRICRFIGNGQSFAEGGGQFAGQTTIEYLLMLAFIAGLAIILGVLFNRRLLGGFFSIVGMIIGEGLGRT